MKLIGCRLCCDGRVKFSCVITDAHNALLLHIMLQSVMLCHYLMRYNASNTIISVLDMRLVSHLNNNCTIYYGVTIIYCTIC